MSQTNCVDVDVLVDGRSGRQDLKINNPSTPMTEP